MEDTFFFLSFWGVKKYLQRWISSWIEDRENMRFEALQVVGMSRHFDLVYLAGTQVL